MLCFVPVLRGCVCCYVRKMALLPVSLQLLRGGIWACAEVPLSMSLLGFGIETMLTHIHMCGVKSSFPHAREECEPKRAYVFYVPDV